MAKNMVKHMARVGLLMLVVVLLPALGIAMAAESEQILIRNVRLIDRTGKAEDQSVNILIKKTKLNIITKDEIVYISASYDSLINDPAKTPYNFYASTSYGDAIRAAMQFVNESGSKKVVFIYPDHPYGKNPIPAGKAMAAELGTMRVT